MHDDTNSLKCCGQVLFSEFTSGQTVIKLKGAKRIEMLMNCTNNLKVIWSFIQNVAETWVTNVVVTTGWEK